MAESFLYCQANESNLVAAMDLPQTPSQRDGGADGAHLAVYRIARSLSPGDRS